MPRTGRGGSRQGTPGTAYANRTDLQTRKVPMATAPNQQYGAQTAQMDAMRQMPMAAAPGAPPPAPVGPPHPAMLPVPLDAPSQRPDEHDKTGVSTGPGPGPEFLGPISPQQEDPVVTGLGILNSLGNHVGPEIAHLRAQLSGAAANILTP